MEVGRYDKNDIAVITSKWIDSESGSPTFK